ncbi:hypothetical protein FN846DRAFT_770634 [Sphaerosporella brunnea]|uniref:Uncharacterized protein n=1 Tax=Sphaerosporella brunnea TaxID=1250544 RepID=A0A5J5FCV3_9PEZI|nr:hypothetical protein FN846DRAFT_770634 [Sphaerosporella brunnea]
MADASSLPASVRAEPIPGAGTGLVATQPIPAAREIFTIKAPLIAIADDAHLAETCAHCLAWKPTSAVPGYYSSSDGPPLLQCAGCKTLKYCSQACQRASWRHIHKSECKIFTRLYPRVLPASVRALVRLLLLEPTLPPKTWESIINLQHHTPEFQASPKHAEIQLMSKGAHAYSGTSLPEALVQRLYCTLLVNTLTLTTPTLDPIGLYFDPLPSTINHSCNANTFITFSGASLTLRSLRPITEGEELTLPYVDTTLATSHRLSTLRERWFFTCRCPLCTSSPNIPQDQLQCPSCQTPGLPPLCTHCNAAIPHRPDSEELRVLYKAGNMPATRQPIPSLHAAAVQSFLSDANYEAALRHQLLLVTRIYPRLYPQPHHPLRVASGFVLAALLIEVSHSPGGTLAPLRVDWGKALWAVLVQVEAGVSGCHGAESAFAALVRQKKAEVKDELEKAGVGWVKEVEKGCKIPELDEEMRKVQAVVDGLVAELKGETV